MERKDWLSLQRFVDRRWSRSSGDQPQQTSHTRHQGKAKVSGKSLCLFEVEVEGGATGAPPQS